MYKGCGLLTLASCAFMVVCESIILHASKGPCKRNIPVWLYRCFAADISRTFPASGKFTASQKDLYNGVLKVQVGLFTVRQLKSQAFYFRAFHTTACCHCCPIRLEAVSFSKQLACEASRACLAPPASNSIQATTACCSCSDVKQDEVLLSWCAGRCNQSLPKRQGLERGSGHA